MKTIRILLALVFVLVLCSVKAQDKSDKPASVIFTAGWSFADLNQGNLSTDARSGFYIGLRRDIKLFPTLHIETGALYVQKGATRELNDSREEFELDYIDIPAALKLKLGGLYALGGVSGNVRLSSKIGGEKAKGIQPFSLSSTLGAGFKFLMFSIDARWNHTLTDILKDNEDDRMFNSYFLIGLSYNFHRR
ncbi:MAG: porin family protein [Flavobacteriales bacterium]|nr:porin family protein [Flavobacteriales bacterium]